MGQEGSFPTNIIPHDTRDVVITENYLPKILHFEVQHFPQKSYFILHLKPQKIKFSFWTPLPPISDTLQLCCRPYWETLNADHPLGNQY